MVITIPIPHDNLNELCLRYQISKLMLFGSVLGPDFGPSSDVDVLAEFLPEAQVGFFKLVTIQNELADLFGREVDLLTPNALSPRYRQQVLDSAEVIYEREG
jgi:predicted nucleotidyltransferase